MIAPDNLRAHLKRAERLFAPVRTQLHNRSLHEERWLQRSIPGFCGLTTINGDCTFGSKGSWPLHGARGDNWSAAVQYGLGRCAHCARCDTISVTLQHRDVSWYSRCDLTNLSHHKHVHDIRTARYRRRERTRTCVEAPSRDAWPVTTADELDCDERYMSIVRCGGRRYLFSRREFPGGDLWDSIVRVAVSDRFGPASVTLDHSANMSHNTAFLCVRNSTLLAIGGQLPDGEPSAARWQPGIVRRAAPASALPLRWGPPSLVASGLKARSRCVDARWADGCDFDGKVSAALLNGKLVIFTRSNPFPKPVWANASEEERAYEIEKAGGQMASDGGGRHVQVGRLAPTADGDWSEVVGGFHQLIIPGLRRRRETNIYFFSVVPVGRHALLSLFPAVIGGRGGVWCSTSTDALHWAKPLLLMPSETVTGVRSRDHPLEVRDAGASAISMLHNVYFHLAEQRSNGCADIERPHICTYRFKPTAAVGGRCEAIRAALKDYGARGAALTRSPVGPRLAARLAKGGKLASKSG